MFFFALLSIRKMIDLATKLPKRSTCGGRAFSGGDASTSCQEPPSSSSTSKPQFCTGTKNQPPAFRMVTGGNTHTPTIQPTCMHICLVTEQSGLGAGMNEQSRVGKLKASRDLRRGKSDKEKTQKARGQFSTTTGEHFFSAANHN